MGFSQILELFWRGFSKPEFLTLSLGLFWRGFSKLGLVLVGFYSFVLTGFSQVLSLFWGFLTVSWLVLEGFSKLGVLAGFSDS